MPILQWLNKDQAVTTAKQCAYRLLEEVPELSYGDTNNENLLIQGDNLEALKALIPFYAGKVKCIFIDPPYNTKSAFEHYDDNLEHSKWLSLMYPRLELLRDLLSEDGSIWVSIDDNEGHYLKVMMDEIFGRSNFINNIVWRTSDSSNNNVTKFSLDHNDIFVYGKTSNWRPNFLNDPSKRKHFKNPDNDPRGPWFDGNNVQNPGFRPNLQFDLIAPNGNKIKHPPNGWRWARETIEEKMKSGEIRFSEDGKRIIRRTYLSDMEGLPPSTIWADLDETGHNRQAKYELKSLFPEVKVTDLFGTPKPERLLAKILFLATNENDLVLDSFVGSGTTSSVSLKMKRRFISIEIGDHAQTHCQPRLKKVIDGEHGGISASVEWNGGGGFRFCKLGQTVFDEYGCLNAEIKFPTLAAHIWYLETKTTLSKKRRSPYLGTHNNTAYYLLYNGILGDRRPDGGNVLTTNILNSLPKINEHEGKIVIYGESSRLGEARLKRSSITFKQIPYDVGSL